MSKVGTRAQVYNGVVVDGVKKTQTSYGKDALGPKDIVYVDGEYKSKYKVKHVPPQLKKWTKAVKSAKKELKVKQKPGEAAIMIKGKLESVAREKFEKMK